MIVGVNSIVKHVSQIKNGIMINTTANVKSIIDSRKIIVGILAYVFAGIVST